MLATFDGTWDWTAIGTLALALVTLTTVITRDKKRQVAKSLISGLAVLECFPPGDEDVSRAQIARSST